MDQKLRAMGRKKASADEHRAIGQGTIKYRGTTTVNIMSAPTQGNVVEERRKRKRVIISSSSQSSQE